MELWFNVSLYMLLSVRVISHATESFRKKRSRPFVLLLHASVQYGLNEYGNKERGRNGLRVSFRNSARIHRLCFHGDWLRAWQRSLSAQETSHHLRVYILRVFTKNTFWNTTLYHTKILFVIIYFKWTPSSCNLFLMYCNNGPVEFVWIWF